MKRLKKLADPRAWFTTTYGDEEEMAKADALLAQEFDRLEETLIGSVTRREAKNER